jgi:hypothetical protein
MTNFLKVITSLDKTKKCSVSLLRKARLKEVIEYWHKTLARLFNIVYNCSKKLILKFWQMIKIINVNLEI